VDSGRRLSELTPEELAAQSELFDTLEGAPHGGELAGDTHGGIGEYYKVLAHDSWLESKVSMGGTALPRVREQLELARAVLADEPRA
jgi:hypothetical protein